MVNCLITAGEYGCEAAGYCEAYGYCEYLWLWHELWQLARSGYVMHKALGYRVRNWKRAGTFYWARLDKTPLFATDHVLCIEDVCKSTSKTRHRL